MLHRRYPNLWTGCVGEWCPSRDNSRSTILIDKSGYGNHGTLTNMDPGTDWQASGGAMALDFDGSNDHVSIGNALKKITGDITFSTWFYNRGNFTSYAALVDAGLLDIERACSVFFGGTASQLFCAFGENAGAFVNLNLTLVSNRWTHLSAACSPALLKIYINGSEAGSTASGIGTTWTNNRTVSVSGNSSGGGAYFDGFQDDVRIYNRCLTPSEIQLLATRRGIAYETKRQRSYKTATVASRNRNYAWSPF